MSWVQSASGLSICSHKRFILQTTQFGHEDAVLEGLSIAHNTENKFVRVTKVCTLYI